LIQIMCRVKLDLRFRRPWAKDYDLFGCDAV
jgi:hypothetical protein